MGVASVYTYAAYVSNAASNASNAPNGIVCAKHNEIWFAVRMPATGDPVGYLTLTGSIDGTNYAPLNIVTGTIGGLASDVTFDAATPNIITINDPAAAVSLLFGFDSPPPYVKIAWTRTSGGTTSGLYVDYFLRSA